MSGEPNPEAVSTQSLVPNEKMQLTASTNGGTLRTVMFTDEYGIPLPKGTVVDLQPHSPHTGLIDYLTTGEQIVLHNSKQRGMAVATWPEEFNDFNIPVRVIAVPLFPENGDRICQNAWFDIECGVPWSPGDNCQDFVTRAYLGRNGSPTRDFIVTTLAVAGGVALAGHVISKISRTT